MSLRESTIRSWELGTRLRELRQQAKIRGHQAAARIGTSISTVSRIDTGKRVPTPEETASLLTVYGVVGEERDRLLSLARGAAEKDWWNRFGPTTALKLSTLASLERRARSITNFEMNWIPGLLQTEVYTSALMRRTGLVPDMEVAARVAKRLARSAVLRRADPPFYTAIIDESALRRMIGSAAVMHRQLEYLLLVGELPNISIRIIPAEIGVPPAQYPFVFLTFPVAPTAVVFLENLTSSMFIENPEDTAVYSTAIQRTLELALHAESSARLITTIKSSLEADPDVLPHIPDPEVAEE